MKGAALLPLWAIFVFLFAAVGVEGQDPVPACGPDGLAYAQAHSVYGDTLRNWYTNWENIEACRALGSCLDHCGDTYDSCHVHCISIWGWCEDNDACDEWCYRKSGNTGTACQRVGCAATAPPPAPCSLWDWDGATPGHICSGARATQVDLGNRNARQCADLCAQRGAGCCETRATLTPSTAAEREETFGRCRWNSDPSIGQPSPVEDSWVIVCPSGAEEGLGVVEAPPLCSTWDWDGSEQGSFCSGDEATQVDLGNRNARQCADLCAQEGAGCCETRGTLTPSTAAERETTYGDCLWHSDASIDQSSPVQDSWAIICSQQQQQQQAKPSAVEDLEAAVAATEAEFEKTIALLKAKLAAARAAEEQQQQKAKPTPSKSKLAEVVGFIREATRAGGTGGGGAGGGPQAADGEEAVQRDLGSAEAERGE